MASIIKCVSPELYRAEISDVPFSCSGGLLDRYVQGVGPRRGVAADLHAVHGGDRVADRVPTAGGRDRDVDRQGTGVTLVGGEYQ